MGLPCIPLRDFNQYLNSFGEFNVKQGAFSSNNQNNPLRQ